MDKSKLLDKAKGCLAGVAIGDAMGLPTQFLTPREIEQEFGKIDDFCSPPDWHPYKESPPGSITDDTEQTIVLAKMIIEHQNNFTVEDVAKSLLGWAEDRDLLGTSHIGPSTGKALNSIKSGANPRVTGIEGTTNGSSMRISPVGMINPLFREENQESLIKDVRTITTPTHNTPIAIAGATTVASAISLSMVNDYSPELIAHKAKNIGERAYRETENELTSFYENHRDRTMEILSGKVSPSLKKRIELAQELVQDRAEDVDQTDLSSELYELIGAGVDTIETVPTSLALFVASKGDPLVAIKLGANVGGDTDTIASIAGAITGAYSGIDAFPEDYVNKVERVNDIDVISYATDLVSLITLEEE